MGSMRSSARSAADATIGDPFDRMLVAQARVEGLAIAHDRDAEMEVSGARHPSLTA